MNHAFGYRRLAVLALATLALGLAGCGRKGGLDLPPQAQAQTGAPPSDNQERLTQMPSTSGQLGIFDPTAGEDDRPVAAKGQKRRIILDPLLD